jgi:hypothetical protein
MRSWTTRASRTPTCRREAGRPVWRRGVTRVTPGDRF